MRGGAATCALVLALAGCATGDPDDTAGRTPVPTAQPGPPTAAPSPTPSPSPTATQTRASCSAGDVAGLPEAAGLPAPVERRREQVHEAARACDYRQLEDLALAGSGEFTASFGGAASPAAFWRQEEAAGREPLRMLAEVLRLEHATTAVGGEQRYVWPRAFARPSWDEVPEQERDELRSLYSERDLQAFEQFGAYAGHRVVITADGDWQVFVAGD